MNNISQEIRDSDHFFIERKNSRCPNFLLLTFIFSFCLFPFDFLFADASSTNYSLSSEAQVAGGALSVTSTNYQVEDSIVDWLKQESLASTSYQLELGAGAGAASVLPVIHSVTPADFSKHYTDESPSFTVSATSPDSQSMTYQVKQDGTLKDGPQSSNPLTWALSGTDRGRRALNFEVIETDGTVSKTQAAYVFRRPTK